MTFKDLYPGQRFEFDHNDLSTASSIATGPWIKLSARRYKRSETGRLSGDSFLVHRVGTINVKVTAIR